ncbi:MAG: hypothetical protein LBP78_06670 [Acidaminococcales bacterium]|jgi:hypothetical protein|nr:hypothetical protein [Acidaminococcales bacterium]
MNLRFGLRHGGVFIWAQPTRNGQRTDNIIKYLPDTVQVIAYNKDGTKSAIFGNDTEEQSFTQITFELTETGCGSAKFKFSRFPTFDEIRYGQRLDIHLFGDYRPWWSGYVLNRPDTGGTETSYEIECHGFYNILAKRLIFQRYQNTEISEIVKDICRQAEDLGVIVNVSKIYPTDYEITDINFDGVNVQECLKQLSEFAVDWVFGVDEYREFYFKPRVDEINEEARFWVGHHVNEYTPKVDADKIVNWARVKGAKMDDETGEQWLCVVEDAQSQSLYGRREEVWTLPSAYSADDAERWGQSEIRRYKDAIPSAKVKGLLLTYPKPDGVFWVRKLSTDGQAAITNKDGEMKTYPISKIKYTIESNKGIVCDMELGEQPFEIEAYLSNIEREARNNELLQQASNQQLKE